MHASVEWQGKMAFSGRGETETRVALDAPLAVGGEANGFRPKELMLNAIAGCTAMDVISILRKMRSEPEAFRVEVTATETEEHPKVFTAFHIKYVVKGAVPEANMQKAISLSQERYCGVTVMYRSFAEVTHEYVIES